jgi:hypothetical protein
MNNNESASFDLFAKPETDDLAEHIAKGSYQWTNRYTRILGIAAIVVTLLSAGAWYGHHSATSAANSSLGTSLNSLRSAFGAGGAGAFAGATGAGTGTSTRGAAGGGFGGPRVTGSITKVSNGEVTIKLDDSTQASTLKTGDSARVTDTAGFGAPVAGGGMTPSAPSAPSVPLAPSAKKPKTSKTPTGTPGATQPPVGGSSGGRSGFFSDPTIQACLKKAGVVITPGVRPDRTDPKIAAAFAKCLPGFGMARPAP